VTNSRAHPPWVTRHNVALLTDQYQLTMVQAYWREGLLEPAVFSLFVRRLPKSRNFLLACGVDEVLEVLEEFRFEPEALDYLARRPEFERGFTDWLAGLRFTGEVRAMPDGTAVFADEPILEVRAPLPEAQIVETLILNQVHVQTVLASKAARVVRSAAGRPVVDFGLRRMQGADAGLKSARAFYVAGVGATSNVLAGQVYGVPVTGTMAHSYVQAHASELDAFRAFARQYPETTLLVDTYDTVQGVHNVVRLAGELGDGFRVRAVRLDSGDMADLAFRAREILDAAGLHQVKVFASSGLDEHEIEGLIARGAPIDGFGVGTAMGVSSDAPALDIAYKLAEYAGRGRLKLSTGKPILPGSKQVFRFERDGVAAGDTVARSDERLPGTPLLEPVMHGGRRLAADRISLEEARARAAAQMRALPERLLRNAPAEPAYPVEVSPALRSLQQEVMRGVREELGGH
jgi:nicotinate phosphoribosyltransferase